MHQDAKKTAKPKRKLIIILSVVVLGFIAILIPVWLALRLGDTFWEPVETKSYSVKIPHGWTVVHFTPSDFILEADCASCLNYKAGRQAKILTSDWPLNDENKLSRFILRPLMTGQKDESTFFEGYEKTGTIAAKNVTGNKYYKITSAPDDGRSTGLITYGYAFTKGENTIIITHTFGQGGEDKHELIEKLIRTLELK